MTTGHSVLQVPVPGLEPFVRGRTGHYDTDYLSADPAFTHAHVTALGPFLPEVDDEAVATVAAIVAETRAFTFTLERIATFPNGIIHLVPEPDAGFRELASRLSAAFPQCPPYAGEFADVRPHLTLDARADTVSEASTRALLGDLVPARCRAERLDLGTTTFEKSGSSPGRAGGSGTCSESFGLFGFSLDGSLSLIGCGA